MVNVFKDFESMSHVWAHQSQPSGRMRNGYFSGASIYSYGRHFEAGRIVTRKGKTAALVTTAKYSSTTAGHVSRVAGATRHMLQFRVNLSNDHSQKPAEWFKDYRKRLAEAMGTASRARTNREYLVNQIREVVSEANSFAEFYGLKSRLELPADMDTALAEARAADMAHARKVSAARKIADVKRAAEAAAEIELWLSGDSNRFPYGGLDEFARLRINGDIVETSMRAEAPLDHVKRAYRILSRLRAAGQTFHANGTTIAVGLFHVDSMDESGNIKAGCHNFEWAEVERIATLAGWHSEELATA